MAAFLTFLFDYRIFAKVDADFADEFFEILYMRAGGCVVIILGDAGGELDNDFVGWLEFYNDDSSDQLLLARSQVIVVTPALVTDILSIDTIKDELKIDYDSEDSLISDKLYAAFGFINQFCDNDMLTNFNDLDAYEQGCLRQALVQLVGDMLKYREGKIETRPEDNPTTRALMNVLRFKDFT